MFLSLLTTAIVENNPIEPTQESSFLGLLIYLIVIGLILYLLILRPSKKRTEALIKIQNNMKIGDKVTSFGGIVGTIKEIKDNTILLEVSKGVHIEMLKSSIIENITQKAKI